MGHIFLKIRAPEERPVNTKSVKLYLKENRFVCFILHEIKYDKML